MKWVVTKVVCDGNQHNSICFLHSPSVCGFIKNTIGIVLPHRWKPILLIWIHFSVHNNRETNGYWIAPTRSPHSVFQKTEQEKGKVLPIIGWANLKSTHSNGWIFSKLINSIKSCTSRCSLRWVSVSDWTLGYRVDEFVRKDKYWNSGCGKLCIFKRQIVLKATMFAMVLI